MPTTKVILRLPLKDPSLLPDFIEKWIADGVVVIWAYGAGAEEIHDEIDWTMIEMRIDPSQMPVTNATDPARKDGALTFEDIVEEAKYWVTDPPGETEIFSF